MYGDTTTEFYKEHIQLNYSADGAWIHLHLRNKCQENLLVYEFKFKFKPFI